jgi:hypothetical protein
MAAVQARIRNMNRLATMQRAVKSQVSTDYVLGIGGYALEQVSNQVCSCAASKLLVSRLLMKVWCAQAHACGTHLHNIKSVMHTVYISRETFIA